MTVVCFRNLTCTSVLYTEAVCVRLSMCGVPDELVSLQKLEEATKRACQLAKAGLYAQAEEAEAAAQELQAQVVELRTQAAASSAAALEKRRQGDKAAADSAAAAAEVQQLRKAAANCSVCLTTSSVLGSMHNLLAICNTLVQKTLPEKQGSCAAAGKCRLASNTLAAAH